MRGRDHEQEGHRGGPGRVPGWRPGVLGIRSACEQMHDSSTPVASVAVLCGFTDQSRFTKVFRTVTDTTPACFKRGVCFAPGRTRRKSCALRLGFASSVRTVGSGRLHDSESPPALLGQPRPGGAQVQRQVGPTNQLDQRLDAEID